MISFIKNNSLEIIKKKLLLLYLFNVTDIIFTVLLLQTGYFAEVNILMVSVVQNPIISILLKVILPALLLYHLYRQLIDADDEQLKVSNIAVNISLSVYTLVNISHLVWTGMLPFLIYFNV
jgi:hypothetical protein